MTALFPNLACKPFGKPVLHTLLANLASESSNLQILLEENLAKPPWLRTLPIRSLWEPWKSWEPLGTTGTGTSSAPALGRPHSRDGQKLRHVLTKSYQNHTRHLCWRICTDKSTDTCTKLHKYSLTVAD